MAHRFHPRCRARSGRLRFGLLRRDQMLMTRTSVRSALDTCPNTAKKFATRPGLCFVPRASLKRLFGKLIARFRGAFGRFPVRQAPFSLFAKCQLTFVAICSDTDRDVALWNVAT